jgi:type VI secretion system VgrG family protein
MINESIPVSGLLTSAGDVPLCSFVSSALAGAMLLVLDWRGEEAISRPYRFEVRLASTNALLDDELMLGEPATLTITDSSGLPHPYHGVVTDVEQLDGNGDYYFFRVVLEPRMALLRQFQFSEIWLDTSLANLIKAVLGEVGLINPGPGTGVVGDYDFDIRLRPGDEKYTLASFTCQFEETCFAFLSRVLEHYGVYYFFEHGSSQETLVLCGDQLFQPKSETLLSYRPLDSALSAETTMAVVRTFNRRVVSQAKQVVLQDFSATNAQLELQAVASVVTASMSVQVEAEQTVLVESSRAFLGDHGLYGQHFGSMEQGQWLADRRAQALGCRNREFHGSGRATGLRAGYPMRLVNHTRLALNAGYQVIEVWHEGNQPLPTLDKNQFDSGGQSSTRFVALPANVQYRPLCSTPKPNIRGVFSAVIDGDESKGRPLLNDNGCYRVSFPFLRTKNAATRGSAWLRMATLSSGSNHGMHFPLLKGAEVLVSFFGGDPDRPIITGTVANSENLNKVTVANATQSGLSSPGGHFIAIEDSKAGPQMKMGAPVGNTQLTLGSATIPGAELKTEKHLQFDSNTYSQYVGNVYGFSLGAVNDNVNSALTGLLSGKKLIDEADMDSVAGKPNHPDLTTEALKNAWVGIWDGLAAKKGEDPARFSAQLNKAESQISVSIGSKKEDYTEHDSVLMYNKKGQKSEVNEGDAYLHDRYKKEESTAHKVKTTSYLIDSIIASIDASRVVVTGDVGTLEGINKLIIKGNNHSIIMDSNGVVIKTYGAAPIALDGNVVIGGSLLVKDSVLAEQDISALGSMTSEKQFSNYAMFHEVHSNASDLGVKSIIKPAESVLEQAKADYIDVYKDTRGVLIKAVNYLAAANDMLLRLENILLQYKAGLVKSPVELSTNTMDKIFAAQAAMKTVLHTLQTVRSFVDLLRAQARPTGRISDTVINRMESSRFSDSTPGKILIGAATAASVAAAVGGLIK